MTHFENCDDDCAPFQRLSFYVDRVLDRIDPGLPNAGVERREEKSPISVVVSLSVYKQPIAIDPELGIPFEPLDCAVYRGRQLLGRYSRIGVGRIATFDASGRWLGDYRRSKDARHAICDRWNMSRHSIEVSALESRM